MLPRYYDNDPHKGWKMKIEMTLAYLSFAVLVSTFILAGSIAPGYTYEQSQKKLTEKGLKKLKKLSELANDLKELYGTETHNKEMAKNLSLPLSEFKDNFGYSLFCKK